MPSTLHVLYSFIDTLDIHHVFARTIALYLPHYISGKRCLFYRRKQRSKDSSPHHDCNVELVKGENECVA